MSQTHTVRVAGINHTKTGYAAITDHQGNVITIEVQHTKNAELVGTVPQDASSTWASLRNMRCIFVVAPMPKWL